MGATMAAILTELEPTWRIAVIERLHKPGQESSGPWHNAGTGHSALCELNYTPEAEDGSVRTDKAIEIHGQFQASLQLWASLVRRGKLKPGFISPTPHMSFVCGEDNVRFLATRHAALTAHPYFRAMDYTEDPATIAEWAPLLLEGREALPRIAATRALEGTDVDFGRLTESLLEASTADVFYDTQVRKFKRRREAWTIQATDADRAYTFSSPFVFIGAGGATLPLLQKAGLKEIRGYGGFPISGKFWATPKPNAVARHRVKVYGRASVGAPPMSVPHLDARAIGGEGSLLFGPFAGFSPRFLREGSLWDLMGSVRWHNLFPMLSVALRNGALVKYLLTELTASKRKKLDEVRAFYPLAEAEDWREVVAGQRVQIIKPEGRGKGVLQFGTEVVVGEGGSMAGLLGASPGASTAAAIVLETLERAMPAQFEQWKPAVAELVPAHTVTDPEAVLAATREARRVLGLPA